MARALVLTTEPLPLPGCPATGAGLRAWGLVQGLRAAGIDAALWTPRSALATYAGADAPGATRPDWVKDFDRTDLPRAVREANPDVIVLQHWGLARELGEVECPLAIDLAGPHLLERRLWGSANPEADLTEKLDALRRADFLTASGERQRLYFLPYTLMAGWPVDTPDLMPLIPFSMKAAATPATVRGDRLVYGGYFLPWQDPTAVLGAALAAMDAAQSGELLFIGGPHPSLDVSRGQFETLLARLRAHPRVRMPDPMPYDAYAALLAEGGVALDCMARNPERELAFTTRTVAYLAAGLPVLHHHYAELSGIITEAGAGWAMPPEDPAALQALIESILRGEEDLETKSLAARALVRDRLDWDKTIAPLAAFCRAPKHREGKTAARLASEQMASRLARAEAAGEQARGELAALRGKRWVRWGLGLTSGRRWLRWPMALAATIIGAALVPIFWVAGRARGGDPQ